MNIFFFNLHGLIRKDHLEIGRDADNGGQIAYVMELAEELSNQPEVNKLYLFSRLIDDPDCSADYAQPVEVVNKKFEIRRIACGGKKYMPKEKLWPHLDEYVVNTLNHIRHEKLKCDWMHGHYADAGYVVAELSELLDIPFLFTSHSLGKIKQRRMQNTDLSPQAIAALHFDERISAEEKAIIGSEFVITSTKQERDSYSVYNSFSQSDFEVIPPGTDLKRFTPYLAEKYTGITSPPQELRASVRIQEELERFLTHPEKPLILALCRPDKRKNIEGLVEAYGGDKELQAIANLAIFAGIRKDIRNMGEAEKEVLTELLLMMDAYDLYGKMAIPKQLNVSWEVPEIYKIAARKRGVFVNVAYVEPFGLTILEAAASGLPVIVTQHGGPVEILARLENGLLVDPRNPDEITTKLKTLLTNDKLWSNFSFNGMERVEQHYSWRAHARSYLSAMQKNFIISKGGERKLSKKESDIYSRFRNVQRMLVCDIDGTLIDPHGNNDGLEQLRSWLEQRDEGMLFGFATGRNLPLIEKVMQEYNLPKPDFAIHSVGTGIIIDPMGHCQVDRGWEHHIDNQWNRQKIVELMESIEGLKYQCEEVQNPWKASWISDEKAIDTELIRNALGGFWYRCNTIISHHRYIDILAKRASKGRAIRYIAYKWNIPHSQIITCGDSGNDLDMFSNTMRGVVVQGYSTELDVLKGSKRIFFSPSKAASGVIEGLRHFGWL